MGEILSFSTPGMAEESKCRGASFTSTGKWREKMHLIMIARVDDKRTDEMSSNGFILEMIRDV